MQHNLFICMHAVCIGAHTTCVHLPLPCWRADAGIWKLPNKWWEFPPWEFHLRVDGGDDWKDSHTPNDLWTLIVFFLIHYTHIPTMGSTCSAYTPSNAKRESWVLNLWHVCLKRHAKNKHKSCKCIWSLLQALLCIKKTVCQWDYVCGGFNGI